MVWGNSCRQNCYLVCGNSRRRYVLSAQRKEPADAPFSHAGIKRGERVNSEIWRASKKFFSHTKTRYSEAGKEGLLHLVKCEKSL